MPLKPISLSSKSSKMAIPPLFASHLDKNWISYDFSQFFHYLLHKFLQNWPKTSFLLQNLLTEWEICHMENYILLAISQITIDKCCGLLCNRKTLWLRYCGLDRDNLLQHIKSLFRNPSPIAINKVQQPKVLLTREHYDCDIMCWKYSGGVNQYYFSIVTFSS